MAELIATIIFFGSVLGMGVILARKIPILVTLPPKIKPQKESLFARLKDKIRILNPLKTFPSEIFLQKILSKIRVLTLKIDHLTGNWLLKLREKAKKKKEIENDKYWQELKNSTNQGNKQNKI